jgi:hypothetical protein
MLPHEVVVVAGRKEKKSQNTISQGVKSSSGAAGEDVSVFPCQCELVR